MHTHNRRPVLVTRLGSGLALVIAAISLALVSSSRGEETVEPRSGKLIAEEKDLSFPAGAVPFELRRYLQSDGAAPSLLGERWRTNWEDRLVKIKDAFAVREGSGWIRFAAAGGEYRSSAGDRLVVAAGGAVRTTPGGLKDTFDAQGRLRAREDPNGNRFTLSYDSLDRLARIEGPAGTSLDLFVNEEDLLETVRSSWGDLVYYSYEKGRLIGVESPRALPHRYAYDAAGRLIESEEPSSGATTYSYDASGRVIARTGADGAQERYERDDAARTVRCTDSTGAVTVIRWQEDGRKQVITDPVGRTTRLEYDEAGRLVRTIDPAGEESRLAYDPQGRVIRAEDAGGATRILYAGDSSRIASVTEPDGNRVSMEYDARGNLLAIRSGAEALALLAYEPNGLLQSIRDGAGMQRRLTYTAEGLVASVTDGLGHTHKYEYDQQGARIRATNPLGGVTERTFDPRGHVLSETDPGGGTTKYEYDAAGRLVREIDALRRATTYEYDACGRLVAVTDPAGRRARREPAAGGRMTVWIGEDGLRREWRYDPAGQLIEEIDGLGRSTSYRYDAGGRLTGISLPAGGEVKYRYDAKGRLEAIEDPLAGESRYTWDEAGDLASVTDAGGASVVHRRTDQGRSTTITDPLGGETSFRYDAGGRLIEVKTPGGAVARYAYDVEGQLTEVELPSGGAIRYAYDGMGNLTRATGPGPRDIRHAYDRSGNRIATIDSSGRFRRFFHDPIGRLIGEDAPAPREAGDGARIRYEYDPLGEVTAVDDGSFPIRRSYDKRGRLSAVSYPAIGKEVRFESNDAGLRTKLIAAGGQAISYAYDEKSRLTSIGLPDGRAIGFSYDGAGRIEAVRFPNGIAGKWEYDACGRLRSLSYRDGGGRAIAGWSYGYDRASRLIRIERMDGQAIEYRHDADGRLIEEKMGSSAIAYEYRPGGDRARIRTATGVRECVYDEAGRMSEAGEERFTHDSLGQLIAREDAGGKTTYAYDARGNLAAVKKPNGDETSFGYAPTGERAWRRDRRGLVRFIHDGPNLLEELDEGGRSLALYVHGPGLDWPLALCRGGHVYFYHADGLGNIALLSDAGAKIVAAYETDAFGNLTLQSGDLPNPFVFAAREYEQELGLYYFRARYYDPSLGRFLTPDPILGPLEEPAALHPYAYARNAPTGRADPLGLADENLEFWRWKKYGISPADIEALIRKLQAGSTEESPWNRRAEAVRRARQMLLVAENAMGDARGRGTQTLRGEFVRHLGSQLRGHSPQADPGSSGSAPGRWQRLCNAVRGGIESVRNYIRGGPRPPGGGASGGGASAVRNPRTVVIEGAGAPARTDTRSVNRPSSPGGRVASAGAGALIGGALAGVTAYANGEDTRDAVMVGVTGTLVGAGFGVATGLAITAIAAAPAGAVIAAGATAALVAYGAGSLAASVIELGGTLSTDLRQSEQTLRGTIRQHTARAAGHLDRLTEEVEKLKTFGSDIATRLGRLRTWAERAVAAAKAVEDRKLVDDQPPVIPDHVRRSILGDEGSGSGGLRRSVRAIAKALQEMRDGADAIQKTEALEIIRWIGTDLAPPDSTETRAKQDGPIKKAAKGVKTIAERIAKVEQGLPSFLENRSTLGDALYRRQEAEEIQKDLLRAIEGFKEASRRVEELYPKLVEDIPAFARMKADIARGLRALDPYLPDGRKEEAKTLLRHVEALGGHTPPGGLETAPAAEGQGAGALVWTSRKLPKTEVLSRAHRAVTDGFRPLWEEFDAGELGPLSAGFEIQNPFGSPVIDALSLVTYQPSTHEETLWAACEALETYEKRLLDIETSYDTRLGDLQEWLKECEKLQERARKLKEDSARAGDETRRVQAEQEERFLGENRTAIQAEREIVTSSRTQARAAGAKVKAMIARLRRQG